MARRAVLKILLVEDEPLNRTLVKAILARADDHRLREAQLTEAETLAAARDTLATGPVDIVLLDVRLSDGSGLELAADLARLPSQQRPLVIALTAGALPEQHDAAIAAGCDAVLLKPYTVEQLETTLAIALADIAADTATDTTTP